MRKGKIVVIGCGHMGAALLRGFLTHFDSNTSRYIACDTHEEKLKELGSELGIETTTDSLVAASQAELILLAVKPQGIVPVLRGVRAVVEGLPIKPIIVSVAAGISTLTMGQALGEEHRFVRVMPNVPALLGCGAFGIYAAQIEDGKQIKEMLAPLGKAILVDSEDQMDAVTGLSGSGPAFVLTVIEALAKGGEEVGLKRNTALKLSAQTVLGAARMVQEMKQSPEELRAMVTSPNGTTEAGLAVLEELRGAEAYTAAVHAATSRAVELREEGERQND